jgi:hypothetical protein
MADPMTQTAEMAIKAIGPHAVQKPLIMSVVCPSTVPGLNFAPTLLKLRDGTTVSVTGGSPLPLDLPADFTVVLVPHTYMPAIDQDVFVKSNLLGLRQSVAEAKMHISRTRHALRASKAAVRDALKSGLGPLYEAVRKGDRAAQAQWRTFCNDCAAVAINLAALGCDVLVMTGRPSFQKIGEESFLTGSLFKLGP